MTPQGKYLVIGQGLAGSVLLYQLEKHKIEFDVIDNNHEFSGSMAAGGIMHPMSFRRLILAWRAIEFIEVATEFYSRIQRKFKHSFFHTNTFYRPFISIEEQNSWMARMNEEPFNNILGVEDIHINGIATPYGVGTINYSGRLEVQDFLRKTRENFSSLISSEKFDFEKLEQKSEKWTYNGHYYKGIIFCEGYQFIYNPYFNYLPSNLTKGEIIELNTDAFEGKMISRGCFIVPQKGENDYLVGSTYRWHTLSPDTTEDAKEELIGKVTKITDSKYRIYHQAAGIRPTISDRRPLIGEHPKYKGLYIFNGMGSKTVMMAPKLAEQFVGVLLGKEKLYPEADIERHTKKHFHKFEAYEAAKMSNL